MDLYGTDEARQLPGRMGLQETIYRGLGGRGPFVPGPRPTTQIELLFSGYLIGTLGILIGGLGLAAGSVTLGGAPVTVFRTVGAEQLADIGIAGGYSRPRDPPAAAGTHPVW
jgi:hypothetical protein